MSMLEQMSSSVRLRRLRMEAERLRQSAQLLQGISDQELYERYQAARQVQASARATLPLAIEAVRRALGLHLYPEQVMAALALRQGLMTEMKAGEGKTLVALVAAVLMAVQGHVHIATVNDYLARRDYEKALPVLKLLGLSAAYNERETNKRTVYPADVVFSSSQELIFDFLRNELSTKAERHDFPLDHVILDEVDFILLDNANSNFSISVSSSEIPDRFLYDLASDVASLLRGVERLRDDDEEFPDPDGADYVYRVQDRAVYLTEQGQQKVEQILRADNLTGQHFRFFSVLLATLEARLLHLRGRDYMVKDERVVLLNRQNGRLQPNSQLEADLQTAIEVKEGVLLQGRPLHAHTLSYQLFFSKYAHMVGMSGTVWEAKRELADLFGRDTVAVPAHRKNRRLDRPDLYFATQQARYKYLARHLHLLRTLKRPALVIAADETEAEHVTEHLRKEGLAAVRLSAIQIEKEPEIIAQAGKPGQVTVSTNMAGRGTDIILTPEAVGAGGLMVIVLGHFLSLRVDNQARGRAGRQGQPGECIVFASLEDEIWRYADAKATERISALQKEFIQRAEPLPKNQAREMAAQAKAVQESVQALQEGQRKHNHDLNRVLERQREYVMAWQETLLAAQPLPVLTAFLQSQAFHSENLATGQDGKTLLQNLGIEDPQTALEAQVERLGEKVAALLFHALAERLLLQEWPIYKRDLEDLRTYLPLYHLEPTQLLSRYIRDAFAELERFKARVLFALLVHFLTARPQKG